MKRRLIAITAENYRSWTQPLRRRPRLLRGLLVLNRALPALLYTAYPLLLLRLFVQRDARFMRVLLVPGISFVLLSLIRGRINAPRPYEVLGIEPLIHKKTRGHSFPSRHVFSFTIIACAVWYLQPAIVALLMAGAVVMAVIRVLGGVHFPRDVISGLAIGILTGVVGFGLL